MRSAAIPITVALIVSGCAASTAPTPPSTLPSPARANAAIPAACAAGAGGMTQTMDGRISGCLLVGQLGPGPHTVVLDQLPDFSTAQVPIKIPPGLPARFRKLFNPREPPVTLTVSPAQAEPGATVTITGRLAKPWPGVGDHPDFCWDGCRFGLRYEGVAVHWSSRRTFTGRMVVPAAPWIEGDPARVSPLASGDYPIAIQCLVQGKGCSGGPEEGVTRLDLHVASPPAWCRTPESCAQLQATPRAAHPGDAVGVSGFAPLVSIIGAGEPFAFQFDLLDGAPQGAEVEFDTPRGGLEARFGRARLDVLTPTSFAELGDATRPLANVSAGFSPISGRPDAESTVAWCTPGAINLSRGGSISRVPTSAAAAALERIQLRTMEVGPLWCDTVALAGPQADPARVILAAFGAAPMIEGPPVTDVALLTRDGGRSWTPVPVPPGASVIGFGGFRYRDGGVQALFASATRNPKSPTYPDLDPTRPLAELSSAGGRIWRPGALGCPPAGPCLILGPYLPGDCAKGTAWQPLLRSMDGGVRWLQPPLPDRVQPCSAAQLLAISAQDALLVNSSSPFPLTRTTNGGATWEDIALPAVPGAPPYPFGLVPGGITALPDGDLLLTGQQPRWHLLRRGAKTWCAVHIPPARIQALPQVSSLTLIGRELWWLTGSFGAPGARHIAASAIAC